MHLVRRLPTCFERCGSASRRRVRRSPSHPLSGRVKCPSSDMPGFRSRNGTDLCRPFGRACRKRDGPVQVATVDGWMTAIVTGAGIRPEKKALPDAKKLLRFLARDDSHAAWSGEYEQFVASNPQDSEEANRVADAWLDCVGAGLYSIGRTLMARIHATTTGMGVTPETSVVLSPPGELAALPLAAGDIGDGAVFFERWPTSLVQCTALLERSSDEGRPRGLDCPNSCVVCVQHGHENWIADHGRIRNDQQRSHCGGDIILWPHDRLDCFVCRINKLSSVCALCMQHEIAFWRTMSDV